MKKIFRKIIKLSVLLGFAFSVNISIAVPYVNCEGGVSVNGLFDYWHAAEDNKEAGARVLTKTITNDGCDGTMYYLVKLYRVANPFAAKGEKDESTLISAKEMSESIAVYPSRLVVAPKRKVSVKLIIKEKNLPQDLGFYRVVFEPVLPLKKYGFDVSKEELEEISVSAMIGMAISTALVLEPKKPSYNYSFVENGNVISIKNNGNSLLFAAFSGECGEGGASKKVGGLEGGNVIQKARVLQCRESYGQSEFRVYPGDQQYFDISAYKDKVRLIVKSGSKIEVKHLEVVR